MEFILLRNFISRINNQKNVLRTKGAKPRLLDSSYIYNSTKHSMKNKPDS